MTARRRSTREVAKKVATKPRRKRRSAARAVSRRRTKFQWWKHGVVYQIYPRSFMDSNGDGIGDLEGIRSRLDHLSWLGVDALWISPCFPSPMADFGYDVSDYCDIDPRFGTLADFDRLLKDAHGRGLRVLLDLVPNHSSSEHPWFRESRADRSSAKRDWYVWRDPVEGNPPNNWLSVFGGSAWTLDDTTGQYYLHSFLPEQPDLNWRNPALLRAMHDVVRFWFERGVDGFRIDVVHRIAKDPKLRDNPVLDSAQGFGGQQHLHDENHPDVHRLLRGLRKLANRYPERAYVGEVFLMNPAEVARYYGRNDELHLAFNFSFLYAAWSADAFRRETERFQKLVGRRGWPDHVLSSHDAPRHASRYDHPTLGDARARLAAAMLLTLRGTPFLYQGEEIGMRNGEVPDDRLQDPLARRLHPKLSRDPSRTPLPWEAGPGAGFTTGEPWLPIGADSDLRNVSAQRADPGSLLQLYRALLALRARTPALRAGSYAARRAPKDVFAFERRLGRQRVVVALNFGDAPAVVSLGRGRIVDGVHTRTDAGMPERLGRLALGPCEGIVTVLA